MARIVRFHQTGGPGVLRIEEVPSSPPGEGEVRIAVKAIGLNRAESLFRQGTYQGTLHNENRFTRHRATDRVEENGAESNGHV
jgi:NADPH:quinone reductase-like Zn-dependent oxidoreductase